VVIEEVQVAALSQPRSEEVLEVELLDPLVAD
jgi:hypothetical protein